MKTDFDWRNDEKLISTEFDRENKEVLQLINQRFLLMTGAITGVTLILGWLASSSGSLFASGLSQPLIFVSVISCACGLGLLTMFYLLSFFLLRTIRIISSLIYVRYEAPSESPLAHEHLWAKFRTKNYAAYSKPFAIIYLILGVAIWLVPFLIRASTSVFQWATADWLLVFAFVLYSLFVFLTGWNYLLKIDESRYREQWRNAAEMLGNDLKSRKPA